MSASVAALLFAAAITPGPNNLVVMDAASRGRLVSALPPIAGIVIGTAGMVFTVRSGFDVVLAQWPTATSLLRYVGGALLLYLAARTAIGGWAAAASANPESPPSAGGMFAAMLLLQVVNPKTWVLAVTVGAAHAAQGGGSLAVLFALTVTVPTACLAVWAVAGRGLAVLMARTVPRRVFAIAMGSVLAGFAVALVVSP